MGKQPVTKKTFGDYLDAIIGEFSPISAAKRQYARQVSRMMLGAYRGAEGGRLRGNWMPGGGSADSDLLPDLARLRERSRDLVRNDGIAAGAVETVVTNIIGSGIRPQSRIDKEALKIDEDYARQLCRQIEDIWRRWAPTADAGNRMNFSQLEELEERQRFINGESIIIPVHIKDSKRRRPYSLALQVVESDRLSTPIGMSGDKSIREGIRIGEYGEAIEYFIRKTHPGDYMFSANSYNANPNNFIVYPAYDSLGSLNIFHLYHVKRAGQTRGEPFFAPVLNVFKDRADYMEAELVANRVAACFAVFIKQDFNGTTARNLTVNENGQRVEELSPGMLERLRPGESIEAFNPNRPGGTFGIFMERILRDASAGIGLPYEIVAKDFSRSNYSNMRAALIDAYRFFMKQQDFVSEKFGQPVLEMLIEEAYLMGELPILDFYTNRAAYVKARWIAPGWKWVDPEKEANASISAIENNLSTLADEAATQGLDWEEVMEQRAREEKKRKELEEQNGIKLRPDKVETKPRGNTPDNSGDQGGNGGQDNPDDSNKPGQKGTRT